MPKQWLPLESNPEVVNNYVSAMGLDLAVASFYDVMSTDDWALSMVPRPVFAVLMLFPVKTVTEEHRATERARIESEGQHCSSDVYFMKQTVGNACGTVGILHAIGNARNNGKLQFSPGCYLERFYAATATLTPEEIADYLENDDTVEEIHASAAEEGQSDVPDDQQDVDTHFICFSCVDGHLYELDGRKAFPINHGPSSPDTVLEDATNVIKQFMARDPEEIRFTIMALAATGDE
jgi:ubiquitin carboxyl-terminal hydrolase L3